MSWTATGLEPAIARRTKPIDKEVLDVLSASTYTDQSQPKRASLRKKQIPLGIVVDDSQSQAEDDEPARPRKRVKPAKSTSAKGNDGSDDANKKHRGRPRIEGQDETAVDRRRTQIRLAQRAYRNRKETTITSLKQQNSDLQQSISRMVEVFKIFQDEINQSQALQHQPMALQHLNTLQSEFEHAAILCATEDQGDVDSASASDPTKANQQPSASASFEPQENQMSDIQNQIEKRDTYGFLSDNHSLQKLPPRHADISYMDMNGFDLNAKLPQASSYFDWNPEIMMPGAVSEIDQTGNLMGSWPADDLNWERAFPQRRAYTYSFQETTFARRLHRLCLERAFRALTNPDTDPAFLSRSFRFTLFYLNKKRLRDGLQAILKRKAGETLENFEVPYFHVGGAGTQFPRRDAVGTPIFPPNLQSPAKAPGPWQLVDNGNETAAEEAVQAMLDEMGYGGAWFDAHDVEEYLKSKGIYLDGSSSFVEVDTSKIALPADIKSQSTTSSAVPTLAASPASSYSYHSHNSSGMRPMNGVNEMGPALDDQLQLLGGAGNDFMSQFQWSSAADHANTTHPGSPGAIPTFEQVIGRKQGVVTFDVERFLDRVVDGASCLGRAPGFRKTVVDSALALAVQEAF